ncbi:MAG: inositol monophosphatase family protein [Dehalococcoidia bacterium]
MSQHSTAGLDSLLQLARGMALEAGALIRERRQSAFSISTKSSPTDLVTDVDRASEALIVSRLQTIRPDDTILGEEGANHEGTSGVRWVIDPLDGTTNFISGYPSYAVSIGVEIDGDRVVGVVHNAATDETFWAAQGLGAYLDGRSIRVSARADLATALVGGGFGNDSVHRIGQAVVLARLLERVADIRRGGSAALDLCAVAAGRLDAFYELLLSPWDYAAADVIIREAGGMTSSLDGQRLGDGTVLAATPALLEPLRTVLLGAGAAAVAG